MSELELLHERMRGVYIGRRFVGEIPESEWLAIADYVRGNPVIWQAQARNLLRVVGRVFGFGFISVPLGVFWTAAMLGWIGKPIAIGGIDGHVGGLLSQPGLIIAAVALGVGAMRALGLKLGYVNFFSKAHSALLKERLGLDEPGECSVR